MWKYDGSPKHVKNPCVHYLFPGPSDCYYSREDPDGMRDVLAPQKGLYPTSTTNDYWYDNVEPSGRRFWKEVAWANVERTLVEVMLLAREQLLHVDHKIKQAGLRYKRVVFLSPDLVLDERGRAFLVEINTNGYMIGALHTRRAPPLTACLFHTHALLSLQATCTRTSSRWRGSRTPSPPSSARRATRCSHTTRRSSPRRPAASASRRRRAAAARPRSSSSSGR